MIDIRLLELMRHYGLNRNAFAKQIDISPSVIHSIVKGNKEGNKTKP